MRCAVYLTAQKERVRGIIQASDAARESFHLGIIRRTWA